MSAGVVVVACAIASDCMLNSSTAVSVMQGTAKIVSPFVADVRVERVCSPLNARVCIILIRVERGFTFASFHFTWVEIAARTVDSLSLLLVPFSASFVQSTGISSAQLRGTPHIVRSFANVA